MEAKIKIKHVQLLKIYAIKHNYKDLHMGLNLMAEIVK